ncbi:hypothetical protein BKA67DRAFT_655102 [Truncatella angustata]|uniref:Chromatin modification-related protein n=1 Tax=Truncatella angustata TaxID=152316 RepID=A0A9P9A013_9PEZI|nr:uncharacterized protein BKA67DRAFT_655102 [Truncatella angustata]KAH6656793.1 hypothetical protein BKA67DRAFT_655102 [Truncatella angustata]KAH8197885.1 hypothetical protein TruAng_007937 [Truncatella angustata]
MKTAKPSQPEPIAGTGAATSSRRQPARQARTNPPRSSLLAGPVAGRDAHGHDQPIDIFPAITHFTDAITSLPKDLVRHFTLLKEVDAKIFQPEEKLFQLVGDALKSSPPEPRVVSDGSSSIAPTSAPMSAQNSINGSLPAAPSNDPNYNAAIYGPENVPRRQLFRETAFKIQEMLVSLEEKNHVISTANEALSKHLARIDNVWPHLQGEFSDEAKWGSNTHWAYPENRISRANATERSRRDGAQAITAAAQALAEEAAARTEARKQAVAAKKKQHQDSDVDAEHEKKGETTKKAGKSRKAAEASAPIGLGITTETNGNPPPKKRRVNNDKDKDKDKATTNGGQPMERALSSVFGNNNNPSSSSKTKNSSPRATPAPDAAASKKRKALPTVNGGSQSKKSKNGLPTALSPSVTSSPIVPNFDPRTIGRNSPVPVPVLARPAASRARNNSTASNLAQRPSSSASNRPNGTAVPLPELPTVLSGRVVIETKPTKETPIPVKIENVPKEDIPQPPIVANTTQNGSRKNSIAKEDAEPKAEAVQTPVQTVTSVVTTKSGRASKPSTPALGNFPEAARSRSSRNTQAGGAKRSHKKGASIQAALAAQTVDEDANGSAHGDDEGDIDANEPRYCYCNGVSYGEMVACDADDCEKEWFHLGCVGLRSAPSSSTKWYCDNCKIRMKNGKKVNGR